MTEELKTINQSIVGTATGKCKFCGFSFQTAKIMTPEELADIKAIAEAATPMTNMVNNVIFIAHARQAVPALIAEVERLQANTRKLLGQIEHIKSDRDNLINDILCSVEDGIIDEGSDMVQAARRIISKEADWKRRPWK